LAEILPSSQEPTDSDSIEMGDPSLGLDPNFTVSRISGRGFLIRGRGGTFAALLHFGGFALNSASPCN
jgi:hypothetical protein